MRKRDEIAHPKSCLNKAGDDEFLFVLLARDRATPGAIRWWAWERVRMGINTWQDSKIREALELADKIEAELKERTQTEPVSSV